MCDISTTKHTRDGDRSLGVRRSQTLLNLRELYHSSTMLQVQDNNDNNDSVLIK